ncbi:hypothetical protein C8R46DRAFT_1036211 [Mycena filopes]|nr:hypothetical protein C8R46DRAFT_1036211 [Mycena filopes]
MNAVDRLPPELWMIVVNFVCLVSDRASSKLPEARSRVSLVCRSFRDLTHAISRLWTVLALDDRTSSEAARACVQYSKKLPIVVALSHCTYFPPRTGYPLAVSERLRSSLTLLADSGRWATLDLLSNWPPTVSMVSGLLVSSTLTSMENLTFSCYSSGTSNAGTSGTAPLESLFADGQFPNLRRLSVSGVQLKWTGNYGFPSLTRLSLRTIPRASWPTFGQLNALFKVAPRIQTLSLLGVGCTSASLASPPIPVASLLNLEVAFGTGSPSDAIHLYNIVRGFSFPNLAQLVVAFHVLPSLHAFASSSVVAGCRSIRLAGRICCDFWLGQLFHSMKEVVELDLRGAADGFMAALARSQFPSPGLPCSRLETLAVRTGQWVSLRRMVEIRLRAGLVFAVVKYESVVEETEATVGRCMLNDFLYVQKHVRKLEWVPKRHINSRLLSE